MIIIFIVGLTALILAGTTALLIFGIVFIAADTIIFRKTEHKKAGIDMRIGGYIMFIPALAAQIIFLLSDII